MNPGYLSIIVIVVVVILLASGWRDFFLRGLSLQMILLFFICWLLLFSIHIDVIGINFYLSSILLIVTGLWFTWKVEKSFIRLHIVSMAVFVGILDFALRETTRFSSTPIVLIEEFKIAIILAVSFLVLLRPIFQQLPSLIFGLLLGDAITMYTHRTSVPFTWGGPSFQDHWLFTVVVVRIMAGLLVFIFTSYRSGNRQQNENE
mgnify:CR=1 FL=1